MIRILSTLLILCWLTNSVNSQELNCSVDIEFAKTQNTDAKVFQNLQAAISEFMNSRKWTDDTYLPHEKIDCSILINIDQEISSNQFAGQFIIQSERPVYNSNYKTVVFSYKDDNFLFEYNEFGNIEYSDNNFLSNLTSFLAFYAYMVIGYDYDSFSPEGGTDYFLKAQDIVNSIPPAQKARYEGWSTFGATRNRAVLAENILSPRFTKYRSIIYDLHRNGMDLMSEDVDKARAVITKNIQNLEAISKDTPTLMLLKVFFLAKSDEIVSLYSNAGNSEKNKIIDLMSDMDPVNASKYNTIKN